MSCHDFLLRLSGIFHRASHLPQTEDQILKLYRCDNDVDYNTTPATISQDLPKTRVSVPVTNSASRY